jgi:hypothetical protein
MAAARAKAPSPSKTQAQVQDADGKADASRVTFKVTFEGRSYVLSTADLGPADDMICRAQTAEVTGTTGYTLSGLMAVAGSRNLATLGADVLAVILCFARRKNGESNLTVGTVLSEISSSLELVRGLTLEVIEESSPEA